MTIAAGFNFDNGVLLCADTKYTGQMALYESKIFRKDCTSRAKAVFAISGNGSYAKMAVRKCEKALDKLPNPTNDQMVDVIESQLIKIHKSHINPHPDRGMVGGPDFWLLIGLWSPIDGLKSYFTNQTAIESFNPYQCIGAGEYLGHYIIRPRYDSQYMNLQWAIFVACTALGRIKKYDANCGGNSEFVVLNNDGAVTEMAEFDISQGEEFTDAFHKAADLLYSRISNFELSTEDVEQAFDYFKVEAEASRRLYKNQSERHQSLLDMLTASLGGKTN